MVKPTRLAFKVKTLYHVIMIGILVFCFQVYAQTAQQMEADIQAHPEHLSTRIQLANIYVKQKKYDRVIQLLNSYTDQLTSEGFLTLAISYSNNKDYMNEVRTLNLLANKEENDYHWRMLLGEAYLKQAKSTKDLARKQDITINAVQQFRKALQLSPKYKPAYNILLTTLLQMKADGEAREVLLEGIRIFGERPELYRELCRLDAGDGYLESAIQNCRIAIKLAPQYPDNYVFVVQALFDQGEDQTAENDIVSAARKFPKSEFVQWAAGTLFFKKKNYPVAGRYFLAATKADPKSGRSHYGLAQSQFESGDEKSALEHFIKACADNPQTIETFLADGGKLKQRGNNRLGETYIHSAYNCHK